MRVFCNKSKICTALARIGVLSYSHSKGNIPNDHDKRRDKNGEYEVWTEDEFDVTRNENWAYITNSLLGDKSAAVRRDATKDAGKHAWSIVYTSLSHQSVVGVIGEIALPFFNFDPIVFPKDGADTINPKLLTLLREHSDLYTGCLVCDFINAELAGTIYMRNFNR